MFNALHKKSLRMVRFLNLPVLTSCVQTINFMVGQIAPVKIGNSRIDVSIYTFIFVNKDQWPKFFDFQTKLEVSWLLKSILTKNCVCNFQIQQLLNGFMNNVQVLWICCFISIQVFKNYEISFISQESIQRFNIKKWKLYRPIWFFNDVEVNSLGYNRRNTGILI